MMMMMMTTMMTTMMTMMRTTMMNSSDRSIATPASLTDARSATMGLMGGVMIALSNLGRADVKAMAAHLLSTGHRKDTTVPIIQLCKGMSTLAIVKLMKPVKPVKT